MQKHSSADFWRPICQISSFFSVSWFVLRMCLLWIKIHSKIRTSRYLSSLRMQRKESDKRRNNVFGLKCLQVFLNGIIFIRDKNEKSIFEKKFIFFKFQLDKNNQIFFWIWLNVLSNLRNMRMNFQYGLTKKKNIPLTLFPEFFGAKWL